METTATVRPAALVDKAVLISVKLSKWGNSRKVKDNSAIQIRDADESLIRITKKLVDSPKIDTIDKYDSSIRKFVDSITMPGFFDGIHFISKDAINDTDSTLREMQAERVRLISDAADTFEAEAAATLERLGSAGDPSEIPTKEQFIEAYGMDWSYLELKVPESLKTINEDIHRDQEKKAAARMENATIQIRGLLRQAFAEHIDRFVDRLDGKREGGKIKIFRDSMVENLNTFLTSFNARNLTDDAGLADLVRETRDAVDGITADDLRTCEEIRENVLEAFREIQTKFAGMGA